MSLRNAGGQPQLLQADSIESPRLEKRNPRRSSSAFACRLELSLGPDGHAVFRLSDRAVDVLDRAESPAAFVVCGDL